MPPFQYYNGEMNADIKTTVTVVADDATPKTKAVVDHVPLALTSIGYASTEELVLAAARQKGLPTDITLECKDGSYIPAVVGPDDWKFTQTPYTPTPSENQTVSFTENVALPAGYAYDGGTSPVRCYVEVKALDTSSFEAALAAAKAQLDVLTDSEADALADSAKLYVAANGTSAGNVTNGVRFIYENQKSALNDAYTAALSKQNSNAFASQAECDSLTQNLQAKTAALNAAVQTGTNRTTAAYLLRAVQTRLLSTEVGWYAYTPDQQPLIKGSAYPLHIGAWTVDGTTVAIEWEARGAGAQYVEIKSDNNGIGHYERNGIKYETSHGALITNAPSEPKAVQFVATVKSNDGTVIGKLGENGNYTATIGAPIQVNPAASVTAPKMTSDKANNISVPVPLTGAEYITGIDTSKITVEGNTDTSSAPVSITAASITNGGSCTPNSDGLFVPVTASCGAMEMRLAQTNSGLDYGIGKIRITIPSGALTVDESSGWYAPAGALTYDAEVWGCNPAATITTRNAGEGKQTVSVQIEYAYKNFSGAVAYTMTNDNHGAASTTLKVRFNAGDWKKNDSGQDRITCTKENVPLTLESGVTYYVWYSFNASYDNDPLSTPADWMNTGITLQ